MKIDRKNLNVRHKAKGKEGIEDKYKKRGTGRGGEKENDYEAVLQILN